MPLIHAAYVATYIYTEKVEKIEVINEVAKEMLTTFGKLGSGFSITQPSGLAEWEERMDVCGEGH